MTRQPRGPMTRAVGSALRAANVDRQDAATEALARRYAALIDNAAPAAKYVKHLDALRRALVMLELEERSDALDHFDRLAEALSAHSVASDLGPKLLAALTALGMTPAARRAVMGGQSAPTTRTGVDELRARRATRAERAR